MTEQERRKLPNPTPNRPRPSGISVQVQRSIFVSKSTTYLAYGNKYKIWTFKHFNLGNWQEFEGFGEYEKDGMFRGIQNTWFRFLVSKMYFKSVKNE